MKSSSTAALRAVSLLLFLSLPLVLFSPLSASAHEMVLPAGTLLQCTLDEPNFSSATVAIGDPVLCRLHSMTEFGQQAFPRGSYLVGHLEAAQDPGHFWGKGFIKIQFDRIGLPQGDMQLDAKVIATRGYKVDKYGDIDGKGHAKRDVVEWMIPPLWPWKIITLPMRGPRPTLKGETVLTLRLMDDVQMPQVAQTFGPDWHFFGHPYDETYHEDAYNSSTGSVTPQLAVRHIRQAQNAPVLEEIPQVTYASYTTTEVAAQPTPVSAAAAVPLAAEDSHPAGTQLGVPVFVLKTGTVLQVSSYGCQDGRISYELASGGSGVISSNEVDWTTTRQVNLQHGVHVLMPGHANAGDAGY